MVSTSLLFLLVIEQAPLVLTLQPFLGNKPEYIIGVPREKQHLYASNEPDLTKWHCLSGDNIVLNLNQINDGVCDCPDGSDEPGTAACEDDVFQKVAEQSSGMGKYFFCDNKNFISRYIRISEVADGICDCCDCSDEMLSGYKPFDVGSDCSQLKNEFDAMASAELLSYQKGKMALNALEKKYGVKEDVSVSEFSTEKDKQQLSDKITSLSNKLAKEKTKLYQARRNYFGQLEIQDPILYRFEQLNNSVLASEVYSSFAMVSLVSKSYEDIVKILNELSEGYESSLNDKVVNDNVKKFRKLKRQAERAKITADSAIDEEQRENLCLFFTKEVPKIFLERKSEHSLRYVIGKSNFVQALIVGKINYTKDILEYVSEFRSVMDDISRNYNVNFQDAAVKAAVDSYNHYLSEHGTLTKETNMRPSAILLELLNEMTSFVNENAPKILPSDTAESDQGANDHHNGTFGGLRNWLWAGLPKIDLFSSRANLITLEKQFRSYEATVAQLDIKLEFKRAYQKILHDTPSEGNDATAAELTELLKRMGSQSYCIEDVLDSYSYKICLQKPMVEGTICQSEDKSGGKKVLIGHFKTLGFDADLNMNKYVEHLKATYGESSDLTSNLASMREGDDKAQHYIFGNLNELNNGLVLQYEDGDQCWNGPRRSATVFVRCSDTFKIRSVHEVTKCNYIFDVTGPMGCNKTFEYEPPKFNLGS
ncbi:hypothetical protein SKDZ_04G4280 [Saccharomyces kudriavzevii ZP591]|nr:hypothetical protein SKDZ_04G4280 [Saccharomyces kudriavzevii ZP591]